MATLFVDKLDPQSGTALEIGSSGDTITIPSGSTIVNSGTATGFGESNTPLFRAYIGSSDQTISTATWTKVGYNTETFDPSGVYDHSSNYRFTPGVAGYFSITAQLTSADTADWNKFQLRIYKNGSAIAGMQVPHEYADTITISTMDLSDDNDYYEIFCYQNSGSNKDVRNIDMDNWFQAFKVSS